MPGVLHWDGQQVQFVACGPGKFTESEVRNMADKWGCPEGTAEGILKETASPLITVFAHEISGYKMPWYYLKGGIQIVLRGRTYKFSFIRPQNTVEPTYYLEDQYRWAGGAGQEDVDVLGGKAAGQQWKALLDSIL